MLGKGDCANSLELSGCCISWAFDWKLFLGPVFYDIHASIRMMMDDSRSS